ncbi:unnamed protein product [Ectocarpus sp. 12 AP-2014]
MGKTFRVTALFPAWTSKGIHPVRQRQAAVALHSAVLGENFLLYSSGGKPTLGEWWHQLQGRRHGRRAVATSRPGAWRC